MQQLTNDLKNTDFKQAYLLYGEEAYLRRLSFGPLALDPQLNPGDFRFLTAEEEKEILKIHEKLNGKV